MAWVLVVYLIIKSAREFDPTDTLTDVRSELLQSKIRGACLALVFYRHGEAMDQMPANVMISNLSGGNIQDGQAVSLYDLK